MAHRKEIDTPDIHNQHVKRAKHVQSGKMTVAKTHFICLPLRSISFRDKVTAFNALLPNTIPPSIIRPTGSLHFTLGVMSLITPEEITSAVQFLHSCRNDVLSIVQREKITVKLKGIANMGKNIQKANVIYAVPEEGDGRLRSLSNLLQQKFKEAGYLDNDVHSSHEVKLHCTLLNTLHMKPRPRKRWQAVIDASPLFASDILREYDFGQVEIDQVQICEMGVKEVEGEIRYKSVGGFSLSTLGQGSEDVVVSEEVATFDNAERTVVDDVEVDVKLKE